MILKKDLVVLIYLWASILSLAFDNVSTEEIEKRNNRVSTNGHIVFHLSFCLFIVYSFYFLSLLIFTVFVSEGSEGYSIIIFCFCYSN